jgi:hypothetical protein
MRKKAKEELTSELVRLLDDPDFIEQLANVESLVERGLDAEAAIEQPEDLSAAHMAIEYLVRGIVNADESKFTRGDMIYVALAWVQLQLEDFGEQTLSEKVEHLCDEFNALSIDRAWHQRADA